MEPNFNENYVSNPESETSVVQDHYATENTRTGRFKFLYVVIGFIAVCLAAVVAFYLWAYGYIYRAQVTLDNTKEEIIQIGDITRYKDSLYGFDEGDNVYIAPGYKFESDIRVNDSDFTRIEGLSGRNFEVIGDKVGRAGDEIYFGAGKATHKINDPAIFRPLIDGDELGVYFLDNGQIWFVGDGPGEAIIVSNPESYREISLPNNWTNHHFLTNGEISYLNTDRIYIDDPGTFEHIYPSAQDCVDWVACDKVTSNWYRDSESVYYNGIRVIDADPNTFSVPQRDLNKGRIGIDKNHVFDSDTRGVQDRKYLDICNTRETCFFDLKYPNISSDGFLITKAIGHFDTGIFSTSNGTYNAAGEKISLAQTGQFQPLPIPDEVCPENAISCSSPWSKDSINVYFNDEVVVGVDTNTFEIIPERIDVTGRVQIISKCGKDQFNVFCRTQRISHVDAQTFIALGNNLYKDKDFVYVNYAKYPFTPVPELDAVTFEKSDSITYGGCDKNGCYRLGSNSSRENPGAYIVYKEINGEFVVYERAVNPSTADEKTSIAPEQGGESKVFVRFDLPVGWKVYVLPVKEGDEIIKYEAEENEISLIDNRVVYIHEESRDPTQVRIQKYNQSAKSTVGELSNQNSVIEVIKSGNSEVTKVVTPFERNDCSTISYVHSVGETVSVGVGVSGVCPSHSEGYDDQKISVAESVRIQ